MADTYTPLVSGVGAPCSGENSAVGFSIEAAFAQTLLEMVAASANDVAIALKFGTPFADLSTGYADADALIDADPDGGGEVGNVLVDTAGTVYIAVWFYQSGEATLTATVSESDLSWGSAFDQGECTVIISEAGGNPAWSGVLAKGASSPQFTASNDDVLQASVTADGEVQLLFISGNSENPKQGYTIYVAPSYDVSGKFTRISGISMPFGVSDSAFAFSAVGPDIGGSGPILYQQEDENSWLPDPATLVPPTGWAVYEGAPA